MRMHFQQKAAFEVTNGQIILIVGGLCFNFMHLNPNFLEYVFFGFGFGFIVTYNMHLT
jgi:membrane protease YdiL (CAAX protease family)